MEESFTIDGREVTRDTVRTWLQGKHVSLWSDWCITHPDRMELAIDWFMGEIRSLRSST